MSVSYKDFLDFAEIHIIDNQKGTEIEFRNSISRAYYAVYLLAKEVAEKLPAPNGIDMTKVGSHEKIIVKLDKNPKLKRIAHLIQQQKLKRCEADYEINLTITHAETLSHFYASKGLISKLESIVV